MPLSISPRYGPAVTDLLTQISRCVVFLVRYSIFLLFVEVYGEGEGHCTAHKLGNVSHRSVNVKMKDDVSPSKPCSEYVRCFFYSPGPIELFKTTAAWPRSACCLKEVLLLSRSKTCQKPGGIVLHLAFFWRDAESPNPNGRASQLKPLPPFSTAVRRHVSNHLSFHRVVLISSAACTVFSLPSASLAVLLLSSHNKKKCL